MPLPVRSLANFAANCIGKVQQVLTGIDPNQNASILKALVQSQSAAGYSLQDGQQDIINQMFPQTAADDMLALIGSYDNTVRYPAIGAIGQAAVQGTLNTLIPAGTQVTLLTVPYITQQDATIQNNTGAASMSTSATGLVTVTTVNPHNLASNLSLTISGCSQSALNGTFTVIIIGTNTFTYQITAGVYSLDSGTYTCLMALLNLSAQAYTNSSGFGNITNALAGTALSISVTNVNSTAYVTYNGIAGGADSETDTAYRSRVMLAHSLTPGIATPPQEIWACKQIPGITRVFVVRALSSTNGGGSGSQGQPGYVPNVNETCIYCVMDNAVNIQPNSTILTQIKNNIINNGLWPSTIPTAQLYVLAPNLLPVNFTFTSITPFTTTMQSAITTALQQFFIENAFVTYPVSPITLSQITSFLANIQDPITGQFLTNYTLTSPSGSVTPASGQLMVLGTVVF